MIRILAFLGGLSGAVGLSQFPEFSQQYLQRLAGSVDELRGFVLDFDSSASKAGLTREDALEEISGSSFLNQHQADTAHKIERYEQLNANYVALKEAEPLQRLSQVYRFTDTDLARRTWDDFRPAVPVTLDGFICAAIGFGAIWLIIRLVFGGLGRVFRRRQIADTEPQALDL